MEWDLGTPWYRPTRINHVVSGSDYGWRSGSGKWPEYYEDSLPALVVVMNESDAACVSRIGADHVHVELLFPARLNQANYEHCQQRVRRLLGFRLIASRPHSQCRVERFWYERLTMANPEGNVCRLVPLRSASSTVVESRLWQAFEVHRALTSVFPQHRKSLDEQFQRELRRIARLKQCDPSFASL